VLFCLYLVSIPNPIAVEKQSSRGIFADRSKTVTRVKQRRNRYFLFERRLEQIMSFSMYLLLNNIVRSVLSRLSFSTARSSLWRYQWHFEFFKSIRFLIILCCFALQERREHFRMLQQQFIEWYKSVSQQPAVVQAD
jgi:hypothetical protein